MEAIGARLGRAIETTKRQVKTEDGSNHDNNVFCRPPASDAPPIRRERPRHKREQTATSRREPILRFTLAGPALNAARNNLPALPGRAPKTWAMPLRRPRHEPGRVSPNSEKSSAESFRAWHKLWQCRTCSANPGPKLTDVAVAMSKLLVAQSPPGER